MRIDYKIYYNDSFVLLTNELPQSKKNFAKVLNGEEDCESFFKNSSQFFDGVTNGNILAVSETPERILNRFLKNNDVIKAGGGIVTNENDELLLIFRRGKWDLPKGKIETGEKIQDGAVREVEEETGVKIKSVGDSPLLTYHAYKLKGKNNVKETSWYKMNAYEEQTNLIPQTEEDIDEVRWVKKSDLIKYKDKFYLLIWDLLLKNM